MTLNTEALLGKVGVGTVIDSLDYDPNSNWLPLDGRILEQTDYPELFAVIGHRPQFSVGAMNNFGRIAHSQVPTLPSITSGNYLRAGGVFVAQFTGDRTTVAVSTDNTDWTVGFSCTSVPFSNLYCPNNAPTLYTSSNGGGIGNAMVFSQGAPVSILQNFQLPTGLTAMAYNGTNRYVAAVKSDTQNYVGLYSSVDGLIWEPSGFNTFYSTTELAVTPYNFQAVLWDGARFLAVANKLSGAVGAVLWSSTDGLAWTKVVTTGLTTINISSIASLFYDSVLSLYILTTASVIYTSSNFTAWTLRFTGAGNLNYMVRGGNNLVAASNGQTNVFSTADGVTWALHALGGTLTNITYGNGLFVASLGTGGIATSPTGTTWTVNNITTGLPFSSNAVNYVLWSSTFNLFYAVGANASYWTSSDGLTWTHFYIGGYFGALLGASALNFAIAYNNQIWIGSSSSTGIFSTSDGTTWNVRTLPNTAFVRLAAEPITPTFVLGVVSNGSVVFLSSTNGFDWIFSSRLPSASLSALKYDGTNYIAVTSQAQIFTSPDAITWTMSTVYGDGRRPITANTSLFLLNNSIFTSGIDGSLLKSDDHGVTWSIIDTNMRQPVLAAGYCTDTSIYFFVTAGGLIYYSSDLSIFTIARNSPINVGLFSATTQITPFVSLEGFYISAIYANHMLITEDGMNFFVTQSIVPGGTNSIISLEIGGATLVAMTGTPPTVMRMRFPYDPEEEFQLPSILSSGNYNGLNYRKLIKAR